MKIENLADLGKIIDLARKKGLKTLEIDGIKFELSSDVPQSRYKKKQEAPQDIVTENQYTEEDALFWSSAGIPDEALNG